MGKQNQPKLLVSKEYAVTKIERQLEIGRWLRTDRTIDSDEELDKLRLEANNWSNYNEDLLVKFFEQEPANGYTSYHYLQRSYKEIISIIENSPFSIHGWFEYEADEYRSDMAISISSLEGIYNRLEFYEEPSARPQCGSGNKEVVKAPPSSFGNEVFIVHGHDNEAKEKVARFVEKLNIEVIILDEQSSKGRTIIEKFEAHANEVRFAIVLLTSDDIGSLAGETTEPKPRARQNVILELGYFMGKLGRERVRVLYEEGVELPSDIHGIVYVPMDSSDGWQLKLAKEMNHAGLPIDPNDLL